MSFSPASHWSLLIHEHPRFSQALVPLNEDSEQLLSTQLIDAALLDRLRQAIAATHELFPMDEDKHCAQLWFHSFVTTLIEPTMMLALDHDLVAICDAEHPATMFVHTPTGHGAGFWYGYHPNHVLEPSEDSYRQLGAGWAELLEPIVGGLAEITDVSVAALWAVVSDAVSMAAATAGNEAFAPYEGIAACLAVLEGMRATLQDRARVVEPRFFDYVDGEFRPSDVQMALREDEPDDDVVLSTKRLTCCMIFHSPGCGVCVSCPKQKPDIKRERMAQQCAALASF
ncbi:MULTISPECIES: (2Fe-2S)-binding protein [Corynebacterium]|uniref:(2Fe-2S)-binding protein n=1 Tax=Corynebacterium TaxID=1716 RepID=UPI00178C3F16|nr:MULTISPECIES: (2Fe-2S)-binding protein [Corynebacterium]